MKTIKNKLPSLLILLFAVLGLAFMSLSFYKYTVSSSLVGGSVVTEFTGFDLAFGNEKKDVEMNTGVMVLFSLSLVLIISSLLSFVIKGTKKNKMVILALAFVIFLIALACTILAFITVQLCKDNNFSLPGGLASRKASLGIGAIFSGVFFAISALSSLLLLVKAAK